MLFIMPIPEVPAFGVGNSSDTVGSVGGPDKVLPGVSVNNERMSKGCLNGYRREILEWSGIRPADI